MKTLSKGANAVLTRSGGTVRVNLSWKTPRIELDASCFAVTANGKAPGDEWFLFYNQPNSPNGTIHFSEPDANQAEFIVHLDQLPANIQKCIFAATLNQSSFSEVKDATITATPPTGEALRFTVNDATDEQALIFAEIYRHGSAWKMRAIGQGFKGGLQPLAEHYGIEVAGNLSSPAPLSQPPLPPPPSPPMDSHQAQPLPPPPSGKRSGFFKKLMIALAAVALIASASILALARYQPQALFLLNPELASLARSLINGADNPKPRQTDGVPTKNSVKATCSFTDEQTFKRYHTLGKNYKKIIGIVNDSNKNLSAIRKDLKKLDLACPQELVEKNQREIARLEQLPILDWMKESTQLNICASIMIKKIDAEINTESRPIVLNRLMKNADRSRNLGSDLTDISRDLSYLNNKALRLIEGYQSNLAACAK